MQFKLFFENYLQSKYHMRTELVDSRFKEEYGITEPAKVFVITFENGARALLKMELEFDGEDYTKPTRRTIVIIRWDAAPFSAIMDRGNSAVEEYKGKGFASKVMSIILGICKKEGVDYIGIWAPSADSNRVMEHYVRTNLLVPEAWSKAELGDFHTRFRINWPVAETKME